MLEKGQSAPVFTLPDQDGHVHQLSDYFGKKVVLYFYPKDDTPGCTTEACAIAELYDEFKKRNVEVFGVSADDADSHKMFASKYSLPFTLLSDPAHKVIAAYGAYKDEDASGLGIHTKRITYIIDESGVIYKSYPEVDPMTHADTVLADLA